MQYNQGDGVQRRTGTTIGFCPTTISEQHYPTYLKKENVWGFGNYV